MNHEEFMAHCAELGSHCDQVINAKGAEYATDKDVLRNFKKAAAIAGCSVPKAVTGMMVKHTVSIFDMVEASFGCEKLGEYTLALWQEKLGDQINYLYLLYAAIKEDTANRTPSPKGA